MDSCSVFCKLKIAGCAARVTLISEGCCNFGAPRDPDGWGELPEIGVLKSVKAPVLDAGGVPGVEAAPNAGADDAEAPKPARAA